MNVNKCKYRNKLEPLINKFKQHINKVRLNCEWKSTEGEYFLRIELFEDTKSIGLADVYYSPKNDTFTISPKGKISTENKTLIINEFDIFLNQLSVNPSHYLNKGIEIDVDGSYKNGFAGYGLIIRNNGKQIYENHGPADASSSQINGELQAVIEALRWCEKHGHQKITIYHDLIHSEKFANGEYKPGTDFTKAYKKFIEDSKIKIKWVKVPAHSGWYWNEEVDKRAKLAVENQILVTNEVEERI